MLSPVLESRSSPSTWGATWEDTLNAPSPSAVKCLAGVARSSRPSHGEPDGQGQHGGDPSRQLPMYSRLSPMLQHAAVSRFYLATVGVVSARAALPASCERNAAGPAAGAGAAAPTAAWVSWKRSRRVDFSGLHVLGDV